MAHDAIHAMLELISPHVRSITPLFANKNGFEARDNHLTQRSRIPGVEAARSWVDACGIDGIDGDRLVAILCRKASAHEREEYEVRSVRTL